MYNDESFMICTCIYNLQLSIKADKNTLPKMLFTLRYFCNFDDFPAKVTSDEYFLKTKIFCDFCILQLQKCIVHSILWVCRHCWWHPSVDRGFCTITFVLVDRSF